MDSQKNSEQKSDSTENPVKSRSDGKSLLTTWLIAYFFGAIGGDRFYLRQVRTGILKLLTFGGLGVWTFVDVVRTGFGNRKDKEGRLLVGSKKERKILQVVTVLYIIAFGMVVITLVPQFFRNVKRGSDIKALQHSFRIYETEISAVLPSITTTGVSSDEVKLCGSTCLDGAISQKLLIYQAKNVSIKKYQDQLQVPNVNTLYIVTDAKCDSTHTKLGGKSNHTIAILYKDEVLFSSEQKCADVPSSKFVNVNVQPYCGAIPSADMPTATYQFLNAKIEKNRAQQLITNQMVANGNNANPGIIDDQLLADTTFITAIRKINYDAETSANVKVYIATIENYDELISQERVLIRNQTQIPSALIQKMTKANADESAAFLAVYKDLGLPESVCSFEAP
jgi:hypothetical protein